MRRIFLKLQNTSVTAWEEAHITHCLSYLRQMVLCNADTTLEPGARVLLSDGRQTVRSWAHGVQHECRDWTEVMDWMAENFKTWTEEDLHFVATEPGSSTTRENL
jgi:hypothetical protein